MLRYDVNDWINEEKEHITVPTSIDLPQIPGDYPSHRVEIDPDKNIKLYYTSDSTINASWLNGWLIYLI